MAYKNSTGPQTFIEINGRRYDLDSDHRATATLISDFVPVPATVPAAHRAPEVSRPSQNRPKVMDIRRPHHVQAHPTQTAQTLMRSVVSRPAPNSRRLKAVTRTDILALAPKEIVVAPKLSVTSVDPKRKLRAGSTSRHQEVRHFSPNTVTVMAASNGVSTSSEAQADVTPYIHAETNRSLDVFERALQRADAHNERPVNPHKVARAERRQAKHAAQPGRKTRTLSLATISLLCLLLVGLVAFQNRTAITLRYASAKAGFHVTLPSYRPAGFAISKIAYGVGNVSTVFDNRDSRQNFTLTQRLTKYDDQSLLANVVAGSRTTYQTLQRQGQTVYVYNNNNAAWVSGGVLYQLTSQGNLSTSQVLDVASSI